MAKRILVIDDDYLVVKTIGKLLEIEGYSVIISEGGKEALLIIEKEEIDLIISDIRMPGMDGVETINVMNNYFEKSKKNTPPFMFITGYAEQKINEAAKELKPSHFLYKPFDKEEFLKAVSSSLEV